MNKQTFVALNAKTKRDFENARDELNRVSNDDNATDKEIIKAKKAYDKALQARDEVLNSLPDVFLAEDGQGVENWKKFKNFRKAFSKQNFMEALKNDGGTPAQAVSTIATSAGQAAILPQYINTDIIRRAREYSDLSDFMTTVNVSANSGHIAIEPVDNLQGLKRHTAGQPVYEADVSKMVPIDFVIGDYIENIRVFQPFLDDAGENFYNWVVEKIAIKVALVKNNALIEAVKKATKPATAKAITVKDVKKLVASANNSVLSAGRFLINKSTYAELVGVTGADLKPIIEKEVGPDGMAVIAGYPAKVVEDYEIGNSDKVLYFGDFKRLVYHFDRQELSIRADWNSTYATNDLTPIYRADFQVADDTAVKALAFTTIDSDPVKTKQ